MGIWQMLAGAAEPWASLYNDTTALQTAVTFGHFGGLLAAGGFAVAADRSTLHAVRGGPDERRRHLRDRTAIHRIVLWGLGITVASGFLMFLADVEALAGSWVFWAKMVLVGLLAANGALMLRAERGLRHDPDELVAWRRLGRNAGASLMLWATVLLAGTALPGSL